MIIRSFESYHSFADAALECGSDEPRLYFLHIPKTAGTSVRHWLMDRFAHDDLLPCDVIEELEKRAPEEFPKYRLISGHFGWNIEKYYPEPLNVVTWLRNPIKRLRSNFAYIRENVDYLSQIAANLGCHNWIEYYQLCVSHADHEILEDPNYLGFSDNLQTRYLSGIFPQLEPIELDEAILERAISNLEQLSFVGICEWMDASIDLACLEFQENHRPLTAWHNPTKRSITSHGPKQEEDAAIAASERFDMRLYEHACKLFEQRIEKIRELLPSCYRGESASQFLSDYRDPNRLEQIRLAIDEQFQARNNPKIRRERGILDFRHPIYQSGWNSRSALGDGKTIIRWAGPKRRSRVFFPFAPGHDYRVEFTIRVLANYHFVKTMQIFSGPWRLQHEYEELPRRENCFRQYQVNFVVPASAIDPRRFMTEIVFEVDGELVELGSGSGMLGSFATDAFRFAAIRDGARAREPGLTQPVSES